MKNEVISVVEYLPREVSLPNGYYYGSWSGNKIGLSYNGSTYELTTESTVKGIGIPVVVQFFEGKATFDIFNS